MKSQFEAEATKIAVDTFGSTVRNVLGGGTQPQQPQQPKSENEIEAETKLKMKQLDHESKIRMAEMNHKNQIESQKIALEQKKLATDAEARKQRDETRQRQRQEERQAEKERFDAVREDAKKRDEAEERRREEDREERRNERIAQERDKQASEQIIATAELRRDNRDKEERTRRDADNRKKDINAERLIEESKDRMEKMNEECKANKEELDRQQEIEKIKADAKLESLKNEVEQKKQQWKAEEEKTKQDNAEALEKQKTEAAVKLKIREGKCQESLDRQKAEYEEEKQRRENDRAKDKAMLEADKEQFLSAHLDILEQQDRRKMKEAEEQQISHSQSLSVNEWINSAVIHVSNANNYINLGNYSTASAKMETAIQAVTSLNKHSYLANAELTSREHFGKKVNEATDILFEVQAKLSQFSVNKPTDFDLYNMTSQISKVKTILLRLSNESRSLFPTSSEMRLIGGH